jgi:hypothetical protein
MLALFIEIASLLPSPVTARILYSFFNPKVSKYLSFEEEHPNTHKLLEAFFKLLKFSYPLSNGLCN